MDLAFGLGNGKAKQHEFTQNRKLTRNILCVQVCDEATASIDMVTDHIITSTLLKLPATVLYICHRLQRIREFDLVLVLGDGQVKEFASPQELLSNPNSQLSAMMAKAGVAEE